jgi:hypothetical protein
VAKKLPPTSKNGRFCAWVVKYLPATRTKSDAIGEDKYGSMIVTTLSHQLTWSHFVELIAISDPTKRLFYQQMSIYHWELILWKNR